MPFSIELLTITNSKRTIYENGKRIMSKTNRSNIKDQANCGSDQRGQFNTDNKTREQLSELGKRHFERKRIEAVNKMKRPVSYDGQVHSSIRDLARLKCCAEGTVRMAVKRGHFHGEEGKVVKWA